MPLYRAELAKRCDETRRRTRVRIIFRTAVDVVASPSPRLTPVHPSSLLLVRPSRAARRVAVTGASATRTTARTATTASSKTRSRSRRVTSESACWTRRAAGAFYTPVPIRPRSRGERHSLRTLPGGSLCPALGFNPRPRSLSTPSDAFQLHPDAVQFPRPSDVPARRRRRLRRREGRVRHRRRARALSLLRVRRGRRREAAGE